MLVEEMVKRREAEERTAVMLKRLMKWIEEMDSESDREGKDGEGLEVRDEEVKERHGCKSAVDSNENISLIHSSSKNCFNIS